MLRPYQHAEYPPNDERNCRLYGVRRYGSAFDFIYKHYAFAEPDFKSFCSTHMYLATEKYTGEDQKWHLDTMITVLKMVPFSALYTLKVELFRRAIMCQKKWCRA